MKHSVVSRANRDHTVLIGDLSAALRDRFDVMDVKNATTLSGDTGEIALTVAFERTGAKLAPRLGVVQRGGHRLSLSDTLPNVMDGEPISGRIFPQLIHEICTDIRAVC